MVLKGPAQNERVRGSCEGEREGKQSWVYFFGRGGVGLGGRGAPRENESSPADRAWEGCSEDAHDCFKVPL